MSAIFISHSHKNNAQAVLLRDWLITNGWGTSQIFIDLTELATGDRWRKRLNEIGQGCEAVIVCLSDAWINSPECVREFTHAESSGKPIFPIMVEEISGRIPSFISDIQITDVSNTAAANLGHEKLKLALHRARIGPQYFPWPPAEEPERLQYRGLNALTEIDAAVFFGRDTQITMGLDKLRQIRNGSPRRILTIAGASGAGKSSFLKAGLLSRLKRDKEAFLVLPTMRPGNDALRGEHGLLRMLSVKDDDFNDNSIRAHLDELQAAAIEKLRKISSTNEATSQRPVPTLVLPFDQAEEFFATNNRNRKEALDLLVRYDT